MLGSVESTDKVGQQHTIGQLFPGAAQNTSGVAVPSATQNDSKRATGQLFSNLMDRGFEAWYAIMRRWSHASGGTWCGASTYAQRNQVT